MGVRREVRNDTASAVRILTTGKTEYDFPRNCATLAQLVEQCFRKAQVFGSSPKGGSRRTKGPPVRGPFLLNIPLIILKIDREQKPMNTPKGFIVLHDRMGFEMYVRVTAVTAVIDSGTYVQLAFAGKSEPIKLKDSLQTVIAAIDEAQDN